MIIWNSLALHTKNRYLLTHILSLFLTNYHTFCNSYSINLSSQRSRQGLTGSSAQGVSRQKSICWSGLWSLLSISIKLIKIVGWIQSLAALVQKSHCCCRFVVYLQGFPSVPRSYLPVLVTSPSQNMTAFFFFFKLEGESHLLQISTSSLIIGIWDKLFKRVKIPLYSQVLPLLREGDYNRMFIRVLKNQLEICLIEFNKYA